MIYCWTKEKRGPLVEEREWKMLLVPFVRQYVLSAKFYQHYLGHNCNGKNTAQRKIMTIQIFLWTNMSRRYCYSWNKFGKFMLLLASGHWWKGPTLRPPYNHYKCCDRRWWACKSDARAVTIINQFWGCYSIRLCLSIWMISRTSWYMISRYAFIQDSEPINFMNGPVTK